jgi:Adipokinetic hormone
METGTVSVCSIARKKSLHFDGKLEIIYNVKLAQVNFSPGWGKRGMNTVSGPGVGLPQQDSACKPSMDTILHIYKLLQVKNYWEPFEDNNIN